MKHLKIFAMAAALFTAPFAVVAADITSRGGDVSFSEKTPWGDIDISFARCMANKLYTFSSVSIDGTEVNHTESDNIGPFLVDGKGWSGGNHLNGDRLSAHTLDVQLFVDGKPLADNDTVKGEVLTVEVTNQLLNPADDSDFAIERAVYNVSGNSIDVTVSHEFQCDNEMIERYYGMQSMFVNEFETLTPGGAFSVWTSYPVTSTGNEIQFTKATAPTFSTFVEHSANGYQATHMTRDGIGDRRFIRDDDIVFIGNSWSKSYHKVLGMHPVSKGDRISWHGIYSWFREPITDNCRDAADKLTFEYGAYLNGQPKRFLLNPDGNLTVTNF